MLAAGRHCAWRTDVPRALLQRVQPPRVPSRSMCASDASETSNAEPPRFGFKPAGEVERYRRCFERSVQPISAYWGRRLLIHGLSQGERDFVYGASQAFDMVAELYNEGDAKSFRKMDSDCMHPDLAEAFADQLEQHGAPPTPVGMSLPDKGKLVYVHISYEDYEGPLFKFHFQNRQEIQRESNRIAEGHQKLVVQVAVLLQHNASAEEGWAEGTRDHVLVLDGKLASKDISDAFWRMVPGIPQMERLMGSDKDHVPIDWSIRDWNNVVGRAFEKKNSEEKNSEEKN